MSRDPIFWAPGVTLEAIEKQVILKAYQWFRGNATQTAIALGVSEKTIRNKLEQYEHEGRKQQEFEDRELAERQRQLNRARGIAVADPEAGASVHGASSGVHAQPAVETRSQHSVPVSEPQKVQEVLSSKASAGREHRRR